MAFLKLISSNNNLSWIIEKNPETGIVIKSNRQGYLFGFFPLVDGKRNENEYCIYFKDASDEVSYKKHVDESFEHLSSSKYNNARFINDAIEELLRSAREGVHTYQSRGEEYDVPKRHAITFNMVETQYKTIDIFQRYFTDIDISSTEIVKNNFSITFLATVPMTLSHFLCIVNLFGIFAVLNSNDFIYLHEGMIEKYLRILNKIDVPYFIRYLFKVRLLREPKKFEKCKEILEQTYLYSNLTITYGDTHDARIAWIKEKVKPIFPIIDLGTGIDFKYLKIFAPKLMEKDLKYYAIEKDIDASERIKAGVRNRRLENVDLMESLDDIILVNPDQIKETPTTIICTEVLEHNEIKEVEIILQKMLTNFNYDQIIISVPNAGFNKHYGLINNTRHEDHKWEYTKDEFHKLITEFLLKNNHRVYCEYFSIGDMVENESVSTGLIIRKHTII